MVTKYKSGSPYEKYWLKEYLVYKIITLLTENSFEPVFIEQQDN